MDRLIFIFLDGVGIGDAEEYNPFFTAEASILPFYKGGLILPDQTPIKAIDCLMGIPGLPQSATGQTTLFTGINIPAILGEHKGSYPNKFMRRKLFNSNLLLELKKSELKTKFINAYPLHTNIFDSSHINIFADGRFAFSEQFPNQFRRRISTTSCMMIINQDKPFGERDILKGKALYQDYSNRILVERGMDLPIYSPQKAAETLYNISNQYDFILYEFFQTDLFGHRKTYEEKVDLIRDLNSLLEHLLSQLDPSIDTLILTSDHGNLEDARHKTHSKNSVPFLAWGKWGNFLRKRVSNLADISPTVIQFFNKR